MCGVGAEIVKAAQVTNEPLIGTDFMCRAQIIGLAAEIDTVLRYWLQGVTASISRHGTAEDTMVIFKRLVEKWQVGE